MSDEEDTKKKAEPRNTVSAQLVRHALATYRLGVTDTGDPYGAHHDMPHLARLLRGGKSGLRAELAKWFFTENKSVASQQALADTCATLEGFAAEGDSERVYLRVAERAGSVFIDMGDGDGHVIEIAGGTWDIGVRAPVLFRRTKLTGEMPKPYADGDISRLWEFVPIAEADRPLVLAWAVQALLQPSTAHPVLVLIAEQGSAKSTITRCLVDLIDPGPVPLRKVPSDADSWVTAANASWVVAIDNLSGTVPQWLSDCLCRAVTGDGDVKRQLYTDSDVAVVALRRCTIINGVDIQVTQGDLAERQLAANLGRLARRRDDTELNRAWADARPDILGGLLTLAAAVHIRLHGIKVGQLAGGDLASMQSDLQSLVTQSVGSGGSGFPWTFPISFGTGSGFPWSFPIAFGDVQKDLSDVGSAILNAPQSGQQVLNTLVRTITGVQTTVDHSLADLQTAVAQLPASPPLAPVATGLQQAAGTATQMGAIITNAGQSTAAQVGGALATAGVSATSAVNQLNDAAVNAIGGAATASTQCGAALAGAFGAWVNAWTGSPVSTAAASDVANAAAAAAAAQRQAVVSIASLQSGIIGLYGSGVGGLKAEETFSGSLPTDFTSIGATLAANTAVYNVATAQGDAQAVVGIWSSPPPAGGYYYLILRGNAALTTYVYLKIGNTSAELGCVVAGVKTVLYKNSAAPIFKSNFAYQISVDSTYDFVITFALFGGGAADAVPVTDGSHVSQLGSTFRTGGFGTDETALPGVISAWNFFDMESFGPATVFVAGPGTQAANLYTDTTDTTADQVTVQIGPSGMAQVFLSARIANNTSGSQTWVGFAVSGANTIAASDTQALEFNAWTANAEGSFGAPFLLTGLTQGATTFKMKYRTNNIGSGTFSNRRISVTPL